MKTKTILAALVMSYAVSAGAASYDCTLIITPDSEQESKMVTGISLSSAPAPQDLQIESSPGHSYQDESRAIRLEIEEHDDGLLPGYMVLGATIDEGDQAFWVVSAGLPGATLALEFSNGKSDYAVICSAKSEVPQAAGACL